jgi:hypothetical protein
MSIHKCPISSLQSFPVPPNFQVTEETYTKAKQIPLNIQFTWGTRSSAPNFLYAGAGLIDHTAADYETSMTYNGALYTLASVQLTAPSHTNWLTPQTLDVTKSDNKEDVMMTFQRDMYAAKSATDPVIIILVNPILRNGAQNGNPLYLTNMAAAAAAPSTLESIFPYVSENTYVYYTTCVNGLTAQDPYKNILVLLNADGMIVSANLMEKIQAMYNKFSGGAYPDYVPPGNFNTRSNPKDAIMSIKEGFQTVSVYNPGRPNPLVAGSAPTSRYTVEKCVPFDPETQVDKDGVITLAGADGQTIQTVNGARNLAKASWFAVGDTSHKGYISLTQVEQSFVYLLVAVIGVAALGGVFAFATNISSIQDFALKLTSTALIGTGCFIAGFLVGIFTFPADCNKPTEAEASASASASASPAPSPPSTGSTDGSSRSTSTASSSRSTSSTSTSEPYWNSNRLTAVIIPAFIALVLFITMFVTYRRDVQAITRVAPVTT